MPAPGDDSLDSTIRSMYTAISFGEGQEPDWERIGIVFSPRARIVRITPDGTDDLDLRTFIAIVHEMVDSGVYTAFYEREIMRCTAVYGSMAHVLSIYETKRSPDASDYLARGVNSIQIQQDTNGWRVLNLLWEEESTDNRLDIETMFHKEAIHHG